MSAETLLAALVLLTSSFPVDLIDSCGIPKGAKVVRTHQGYDMVVYRKHDIVSDTISRSGSWEAHAHTALSPHMTPATVFVDIGANIGWYSMQFAKTHKVMAFEPFESNLRLFNATLCLNRELSNNIALFPHGLSDKEEHCDLHQIPNINFGDTVSACEDARKIALIQGGYKKLGTMHAYTLDSVANAHPRLLGSRKVVKMDVEGYEYTIIRAAHNFFTTGQPPVAVYAEVFQLGSNKDAFFAKFNEWGYRTNALPSDNDALFVKNVSRG